MTEQKNELLDCIGDLLDTVYKLHPHGKDLRKRENKDLEVRLRLLKPDVFDPDKTIRRILIARKLIKPETRKASVEW